MINNQISFPSCTLKVNECLCWYQTDSPQCRSPLSASKQWIDAAFMVWAASSGRTLSIRVSFPSLTVSRLSTNCDLWSDNQQYFSSITWADVMMVFVTYSFIPPCSCYSLKSVIKLVINLFNAGLSSSVMGKFSLKYHELLSWWTASKS